MPDYNRKHKMAIPALLLLLVGIASFVAGIRLLKRGRWPTRVGDEPRCRACKYLLIGIDSERCPECGAALGARNVLHGARVRRAGLAAAGACLILLGILLFIPGGMAGWNSIDWIRIEPTSWLVRDVKSSFSGLSWRELQRRNTNGSLSDAQIQAIVEIALQQQAATTRSGIADDLVAFAGDQLLAGKMTQAQRDRFCGHGVQFSLLVRPTVRQGEPVPYTLTHRCGCAHGKLWVADSIRGIKLDGKAIDGFSNEGAGAESGLGAGGSVGSTVKCSTIGKHELTLVARMILYHGTFNRPASSTLIYQEDRDVSGDFEMVAAAADQIGLITDPKVIPQLRVAINPDGLEYSVATRWMTSSIDIAARPYDIAFDVIGRWNAKEHLLGSISLPATKSIYCSVSGNVAEPPPSSIDIILRSSEKVARGTVDETAIWNGELIYPNLPVKMIPK